MFHWIAVALGVLFALWQLFYTFLAVSSLTENTGSAVFSWVVGLVHGACPAAFLFWGYRRLLRQISQRGLAVSLLGAAVCLAVYFSAAAIWNKIVLGETPENWKIALLTGAQAALTAAFLYGFHSF